MTGVDTASRPPDPDWADVIRSGTFGEHSSEQIFAACRALDPSRDGTTLGALMQELGERATRYLRRRVDKALPNGGVDIIEATVARVYDAALGASPADAEGFAVAFNARLSFRLGDQVRAARLRGGREQTHARDEEGTELPIPDLATVTPEQALAIKTLLVDADLRKQQALALHTHGYPVSSKDPDAPTVSKMLNVSARTAEAWIREMKAQVLERMKQ